MQAYMKPTIAQENGVPTLFLDKRTTEQDI